MMCVPETGISANSPSKTATSTPSRPNALTSAGADLAGAGVVLLQQQGRVEDLHDRLHQDGRGGRAHLLATAEGLLGALVDALRLQVVKTGESSAKPGDHQVP